MRTRLLAVLGATVTLIAIPTAAVAAGLTAVWEGDVDQNWSVAGNWSTNAVPDPTDSLSFTSGTVSTNDLGPLTPLRANVTFDSAGIVLDGDSLRLESAAIAAEQSATIDTDVHTFAPPPPPPPNVGIPTAVVQVSDGATLTVTGALTADAGMLQLNTTGDLVVNGPLDGPGTVVKTGLGTLELTGGGSGHSAPVKADMGTLHITGNMSTVNVELAGYPAYNVFPVLSGGSAIPAAQQLGDISLADAVLAPGLSAGGGGIAELTGTGGLIAIRSSLLTDVSGTDHDLVTIAGVANVTDMKIDVTVGTLPAVGYAWDVIDADDVVGTLRTPSGTALPDDATFADDGNLFRIDYGSTYVVLTYLGAAPAPAPAALPATGIESATTLLGALGLLALGGSGLVLTAARRRYV